jgi:hypothetical protein
MCVFREQPACEQERVDDRGSAGRLDRDGAVGPALTGADGSTLRTFRRWRRSSMRPWNNGRGDRDPARAVTPSMAMRPRRNDVSQFKEVFTQVVGGFKFGDAARWTGRRVAATDLPRREAVPVVRLDRVSQPDPDPRRWQAECQKNVETIPSRISVQDTSRRTDSSVAPREGEGMTHDRASVPAASRQACKFAVSARTCCSTRRARPRSARRNAHPCPGSMNAARLDHDATTMP